MIVFTFINGSINPADILSKHWGYAQIWQQLKPLLFWYGETDYVSNSKSDSYHFEQKGSDKICSKIDSSVVVGQKVKSMLNRDC